MSADLTTLLGAAGVVAAMLTVLLPVIVTQGKGLRRELDHLRDAVRSDVAEVRADLRTLTGRVDALAERVARIEGKMTEGRARIVVHDLPDRPLDPRSTEVTERAAGDAS